MAHVGMLSCCGIREWATIQTYWTGGGIDRVTKDWSAPKRLMYFLMYPSLRWEGTWEHPKKADGSVDYDALAKFVTKKEPTFNPSAAHFIFSDAHEYKFRYGKQLAKYILKNRLGKVIATEQSANPNHIRKRDTKKNTEHMITCYVFTPDFKAMTEYLIREFGTPKMPK